MMRALFWGIIILALGWSGYWFVGSRTVHSQTTTWFEDRRAEGWAADTANIKVGGFPNRFDTTLKDIVLVDPQTGLGWEASFFQILALSYQPTSVIAVWPNSQTIRTPNGDVAIRSDDMRASLRLKPNASLALENAVFDMANLHLSSDRNWTAGAEKGMVAIRRIEGNPQTYDIFTQALNVLPGDVLKPIIDPQGRLPDVFQSATLDIQATFDRPWDRTAIEVSRPQPTKIDVRRIQAIWGKMEVHLAGTFDVDPQGWPDGQITVKVTNWRDILALGVENGTLPASFADTLTRLLSAAAKASGPDNTLDIPLTLKDRQIRFGFIPLGQAPNFQLR